MAARIVVVDDDEGLRHAIRRALRLEGYDVAVATDGADALAQLFDLRADLVVLDVLMPVLDGVSTCRRLRASGDRTPVLMLTARDSVSDRVVGLDAGADDYLTSPIFAGYVLATLVVAGIIGLITVEIIDAGMNHFGDPSHRIHDVSYGLLFATLVVGVAAQLRRPHRNVSAMVMALIPPGALLLTGVLVGDVDVMFRFNPLRNAAAVAAVAALVHPAGRSFFRSFTLSRVSRPMLALVAVAAVPLIGYASTNLRLQRSVADGHGMMGHYGFMAAVAFTVIAVGVLASLRADGWRLPAWVAGLLPAVVGLASILVPDGASSLDPLWALAGIAWGVAFTGAAEFTNAMKAPKGPGSGVHHDAPSQHSPAEGTLVP